jgi:hypothetical protein
MVKKTPEEALSRKLGLKDGFRSSIFNAPAGLSLPKGKNIQCDAPLRGEFDLILHFAFDGRSLQAQMTRLKAHLKRDGRLWVAWQKGHVTDLNRDGIVITGHEIGLDSVSSCSIDERWSCLKFMFPKSQRQMSKRKA